MITKRFLFPIRVYYEDTDAVGIVYHANYLRFMERARTEILRTMDPAFGTENAALFVASEVQLKFLRPSYLHDLLEITTVIDKVSYASIIFKQQIQRKQSEEAIICCEGEIKIVCVDAAMRPRALPAYLKNEYI